MNVMNAERVAGYYSDLFYFIPTITGEQSLSSSKVAKPVRVVNGG